ncbi:MAG: exodeoxyribonuclease VII large subunit [Candidatus Electrothrix aestuarii]|uniref:Exodeoxyribonuclease 7 large subunit n=1 Tax=Candidatus Electrothrix aestuarii TaxID=3062594 RepID=A0AAU8LRR4_9BACT|nr:exodeoxyribonuclease VII large subunit [Candidatus Electrothrix aestuarii]
MLSQQKIFSVSELTRSIKSMLEGRFAFISVVGEISGLRQPGSGHMYFTLKDDQAQIKAVLFKMQQRYLQQPPKDGDMVVCLGRVSVYEPRGDYQLIIDTLDYHGEGALQLAFEQLKKRLDADGLFDQELKKPIPPLPEHLILVTSPSGAAVHDFIRIAQKRYPQVQISVYPAAVQGEQAAKELCLALSEINLQQAAGRLAADAIILCRGGGSAEDLQAFNNEELAWEIHRSTIPVVSAVGHEIDFTIADLVADLRAPTPSGAAEMLLPDGQALREHLADQARRLHRTMQAQLERYQERITLYRHKLSGAAQPVDTLLLRLDHMTENMEHAMRSHLAGLQARVDRVENRLKRNNPLLVLNLYQQRIEEMQRRLRQIGTRLISDREQELARAAGVLEAVSPLSTLARGYAVARKNSGRHSLITTAEQVQVGGSIEVLLHQGRLECEVTKVEPEERGV